MVLRINDITKRLATLMGVRQDEAKDFLDCFIEVVKDAHERGDSVQIRGFGCFDIVEKKDKKYKDMHTGEMRVAEGHYSPRFFPGEPLKIAVKKWEDSTKRGVV